MCSPFLRLIALRCDRRARPFFGRAQREQRKLLTPLHSPSEAARCASTVNHQTPSPLPNFIFKGGMFDSRMRASNEHIAIVRLPRAGGRPGYR